MTLIVKIMSDENLPDDDPRKSYVMYGNVSSVAWVRQSDEYSFARMYVRDDVKTAVVPGFSEHEVLADIGKNCNAYVMNERGKTIGTFCSNPLGDNIENEGRGSPAPIPTNEQIAELTQRAMSGRPQDVTASLTVDGTLTTARAVPRGETVTVLFGHQNFTRITLLNRPYTGRELAHEMGVSTDRSLQMMDNYEWKMVKAHARYYPVDGDRFREVPE